MARSWTNIFLVSIVVLCVLHPGISYGSGPWPKNLLEVKVSCPSIKSQVPFKMTLTVKNNHDYTIYFNRITMASINPNLNFIGPVERVIPSTYVTKNSSKTVTLTFTVKTDQPIGTIVPLVVNLFYGTLSTDTASLRAVTIAGAKIY